MFRVFQPVMADMRLKTNGHGEDRLSSLPDSILIEILSLLPINSAAATSVLSRRWRHLWTAVTRLILSTDPTHFKDIVDKILGQLTSPKLSVFKLILSPSFGLIEEGDADDLCLRRVMARNVEYAYIDVECCFYEEYFWIPDCLISSECLVVLEVSGMLLFELPSSVDFIQLPNLNSLKLHSLVDVPKWLKILIAACPLLEHLDLGFKLNVPYTDSQIECTMDLVCPNLKSLRIVLESSRQTERAKIVIDAPQLTTLDIRDCYSFYYFKNNPSALVRACVDLRMGDGDGFLEEDGYEDGEYEEVECLRTMSKFVKGMSFVSKLDLKIESPTSLLDCLFSKDDDDVPIFCNLTRFETTLNGIGLNGWESLLLSLHCFPNLKHLKVNMEDDPPLEHSNLCIPTNVLGCLVNTLKTIQILGFIGIRDDLNLLEYFLRNAKALEELHLQQVQAYTTEEYEKAYAMWKECQFCKSVFKLPRHSSTCEVLFSGTYITASSNTFKKGCLTCQLHLDD